MGTTVGDLKQQVERTTGIPGVGTAVSLLIYVDMLLDMLMIDFQWTGDWLMISCSFVVL